MNLLRRANLPVLVPAALGGLLLAISDFLTLIHVDVVTASCSDLADPALADRCVTTGAEQHSYAFLVLGVLALVMAYGAGIGLSRPAAGALLVIGVAALLIVLIGDLPDIHKSGQVGIRFSDAEAKPGAGFWVELVGAALAVIGGVLGVSRTGAREKEPGSG